jgi:cytochrome bd-type quinol oxidase subunit 2
MMRSFQITLMAISLLLPLTALAGPDIGIGNNGLAGQIAQKAGYDQADQFTLSQTIGRIIKVMLSLVGTVFMALVIYAGILWMTAAGNEEQVEKATKIVRSSILGLVIVIGAYGITVFVLLGLSAASGQNTQIGNSDIGAGGFWSSFNQQMKSHWQQYVWP